LYNIEEYELALRTFLKAREIREKLLGVEHVDTATTFNNLGCCMFMLDRYQEATAYYTISQTIYEA
jgi:tetratricopeptide (TPR) repeat protein